LKNNEWGKNRVMEAPFLGVFKEYDPVYSFFFWHTVLKKGLLLKYLARKGARTRVSLNFNQKS